MRFSPKIRIALGFHAAPCCLPLFAACSDFGIRAALLGPRNLLISSPDGPAEVVQRRPTGTSRFWVQSVHRLSTLRFAYESQELIGEQQGLRALESSSRKEGQRTDEDIREEKDESQNLFHDANLDAMADLVEAPQRLKPFKLKKRNARKKAFSAAKALRESVGTAWEAIQLPAASLAPRDPTHLLCQLGRGGEGAVPLSESDELVPHALSVLDRLPAEDTHRIGLIYVGEGDGDETSILDNIAGSEAYLAFLRRLGSFMRLGKTAGNIFTGGLDASGRDIDGEYCLHWGDSATQVVFHVTTMMPNSERSGGGVLKKRHVGNDHVNVIWSEKGPDFDAKKMVDSQFNSVHIVVSPGGRSLYRVRVRVNKPNVRHFGPLRPEIVEIVTEEALGPLVRATAINADVVCSNVVANWEERASQIARIGERVKREDHPSQASQATQKAEDVKPDEPIPRVLV